MPVSLSIIVVNYRTPHLVIDCLNSIYQQTRETVFEIIVVDNASEDDSKGIITTAFENIRWIQMSYNAGFARANNEGIRNSNANVVLLLNSDTLNKDNAIGNCFRDFQNSKYVACGVQLLNPDGSPQISGNFFMPGGLNFLLPLPYIGNTIKFLGNVFKVKKPNVPNATSLVEVDWINGAFLMVKKTAIEIAGLMDEDFFLYAEEAEWCGRLKKVGKLCIYGQYHVIHLQGATANVAFDSSGMGYYNLFDKKGFQIMLSNFVRIRKQFGLGWFLIHLIVFTLSIPVIFIGSFVENILLLRSPLKDFKKAASFTLNMGRLWKYLPPLLVDKPFFYKVL